MLLKPALRKATELGFALTAIATLILAGCGGGGANTSSGGDVSTVTASVTPYKGPYYNGATVVLKDANGSPITLVAGGTVNASGVASVTFPSSVTYPLIVEVTGSYFNEVTGAPETGSTPLRGLIQSAGAAASGVPVTLVTETAVTDLQTRLGGFSTAHPIQAASAVAAMSVAGTIFGVPASAVPAFDPATNQTSDTNTLLLSAWAMAANGQSGATLADRAQALATGLVNPTNAPTSVVTQATFDAALLAMTSGASSVMAAGASAPSSPAIPTATYGALYASAVGAGGGGGAVTPSITGFSPTMGAVGTVVTITGTNLGSFTPAPIVKFGTTVATPTYAGSTSITVAVPAGLAVGSYAITIGGAAGTPVAVGTFNVTAAATAPAAPTGVAAAVVSGSQINLSWSAVTGATSYNVYSATASGVALNAGNKVSTVTNTSANITGLAASTTYYYVVTALSSAGESVASAEVSATTTVATPANTFTPGGFLTASRDMHTSTLLVNGKVLVSGGRGWDLNALATVDLYDPATKTSVAAGAMSAARYGHTATLLANGKVLVIGGKAASSTTLATAELYDPATNTWTAAGTLTNARSGHVATLLTNGKVLVSGGGNESYVSVPIAELFDPVTNTSSVMPGVHSGNTATLLTDGKVLFDTELKLYDPATDSWTATGARANWANGAATLLANGKVLVNGNKLAQIYDPASNTWAVAGTPFDTRSGHTATLMPNGKVLVIGGSSNTGALPTAEFYDPATNAWTLLTGANAMVDKRSAHTASLLANGKVSVIGGFGGRYNPQGPLSNIEVFW
jgi:N-acetylneuraminic acid mutarotase